MSFMKALKQTVSTSLPSVISKKIDNKQFKFCAREITGDAKDRYPIHKWQLILKMNCSKIATKEEKLFLDKIEKSVDEIWQKGLIDVNRYRLHLDDTIKGDKSWAVHVTQSGMQLISSMVISDRALLESIGSSS